MTALSRDRAGAAQRAQMLPYRTDWETFRKTGERTVRNTLVVRYLPLARHVASTFPQSPRLYSFDDLVSWACMGLIDAVERFDPGRNVKFETYAIPRIRGEIKDNIRRLLPSSVLRNRKRLDQAYSRACARLGRPPSERELAAEMNVSVAQYRSMAARALPFYIVSFEEAVEKEWNLPSLRQRVLSKDFSSILEVRETRDALAHAIGTLPEREARIVRLYYYEGLAMREIADILGLTEGRISQLHTQAILHLRTQLKKSMRISDTPYERKENEALR